MSNFFGAVYTPTDIADLLTEWAIQEPSDTILDLGIGEGSLVFSAYQRLTQLGADSHKAQQNIYGTEVDPEAYNRFSKLCTDQYVHFPNVKCDDFFHTNFPQVDAIIGNPPYVRRQGFPASDLETIRHQVLLSYPELRNTALNQLTDLYVYFLLKSFTYLQDGGRLSVIVADSWLNARYGRILKKYLKQHFEIEQIISFDRPIFPDAQVKPSLIFATKKDARNCKTQVGFTRVMNGLPAKDVFSVFQHDVSHNQDIHTTYIQSSQLNASEPWGVHFKISEINKLVSQSDMFTNLNDLAQTQIGIQTLAKDFFTLTLDEAKSAGIEKKYLLPFAHSVAQFQSPVIDTNTAHDLYVLACSDTKGDLQGTSLLRYIEEGEAKELAVRGQREPVIGYHNKERIRRARRTHWYDLKTEIQRRGCAPILLPRFIYRRFVVLWNKAQYVPGGAVIQLCPRNLLFLSQLSDEDRMKLFLSILNSTLLEVLIRGHAQMYGGGSYNIGLSQIKLLPFPDISKISNEEQKQLIVSYENFLETNNRTNIDQTISTIFSIDHKLFSAAVEDLIMMATTMKKKAA